MVLQEGGTEEIRVWGTARRYRGRVVLQEGRGITGREGLDCRREGGFRKGGDTTGRREFCRRRGMWVLQKWRGAVGRETDL